MEVDVDMEDVLEEENVEEEEETPTGPSTSDPHGNTTCLLNELMDNSKHEMRDNMGEMRAQMELMNARIFNLESTSSTQAMEIRELPDLVRDLRGGGGEGEAP